MRALVQGDALPLMQKVIFQAAESLEPTTPEAQARRQDFKALVAAMAAGDHVVA